MKLVRSLFWFKEINLLYATLFMLIVLNVPLAATPSPSFLSHKRVIGDLYSPINMKKKKRTFLITGCARSGTTYIEKFFKLNKLAVAHERDASFGIVSWTMAVDSSFSPWGPAANSYIFEHVFHQVRHPLKTISSVYSAELARSWKFIWSETPEINWRDSRLVKAAKYWYYWNLTAERKAELTYRIEDVHLAIPELNRILGVELNPALLEQIPVTTNHRHLSKNLTWNDLHKALNSKLYKRIVLMAERYGYEVTEAKKYL